MPSERDVSPIVRTYIKTAKTPSGKSQIHVRLYSHEYDLDKRGTGNDLASAKKRARRGVPRPR